MLRISSIDVKSCCVRAKELLHLALDWIGNPKDNEISEGEGREICFWLMMAWGTGRCVFCQAELVLRRIEQEQEPAEETPPDTQLN